MTVIAGLIAHTDYHKSVESLVRSFLPDRRVKLGAALNAVGMTPADQAHEITSLSAMSVEDLYALPNAPFTQLTPEQLLRYAQIVDTALFKSYLVVRPILAGSLFRVPNWCEVEEVEGVLRARGVSQRYTSWKIGRRIVVRRCSGS